MHDERNIKSKVFIRPKRHAYINGVKVGKVVACVEIAPHVYIKLPRRGYFSLKVKKDAWKK